MHMRPIRPVLAQFATSGHAAMPVLGNTYIDTGDSMIHAVGAVLPLIADFLGNPNSVSETILTEANNDPADRDLVRAGDAQLESLITRSYEDPIDPDTVRTFC